MRTVDDLVTWLRAQLAEDERDWLPTATGARQNGKTTARRVLAEVDAKRRHIARWEHANTLLAAADNPSAIRNELLSVRRAFADAIADDALAYADRPGYRDEWRPE